MGRPRSTTSSYRNSQVRESAPPNASLIEAEAFGFGAAPARSLQGLLSPAYDIVSFVHEYEEALLVVIVLLRLRAQHASKAARGSPDKSIFLPVRVCPRPQHNAGSLQQLSHQRGGLPEND